MVWGSSARFVILNRTLLLAAVDGGRRRPATAGRVCLPDQ
jgi:hypothetical protein